MGALGTAAMASMDERLPWYRKMSAENRSWIGLVAQAGVAAFVEWFKRPARRPAITVEVFGTAPRELIRTVSLQHTVELLRVIIDVVETQVESLAAPGGEDQLREGVLLYTREFAFSAAKVYARAAEARGAWDARLEALVVDALVRGETEDGLDAWAAALGWSMTPVQAIAGYLPEDDAELLMDDIRALARRAGHDVLAGTQGTRLIIVVGGAVDDGGRADKAADDSGLAGAFAGMFGPGPIVLGPRVPDLHAASRSVRIAVGSLRAAACWPDAPRPVPADELLPERALDGDQDAREQLVRQVFLPLRDAGSPLLDTLTTYLEHGSSLEACARMLFVHPNTVRYRLRRIGDLTGFSPTEGRHVFALQIAVTLGRLGVR
ncbi:helix-turn-helix domain-containing protein [Allonocardiopsis opalescens]